MKISKEKQNSRVARLDVIELPKCVVLLAKLLEFLKKRSLTVQKSVLKMLNTLKVLYIVVKSMVPSQR